MIKLIVRIDLKLIVCKNKLYYRAYKISEIWTLLLNSINTILELRWKTNIYILLYYILNLLILIIRITIIESNIQE